MKKYYKIGELRATKLEYNNLRAGTKYFSLDTAKDVQKILYSRVIKTQIVETTKYNNLFKTFRPAFLVRRIK